MDIPIISPLFGVIIKFLYNIFGNSYLLTLFVFAVLMKVVLLPFGIKQQKNSIKQSKLRPKEMAIRNKYKGRNDKATQQKMQEEIMKLYQEENFNPMAGCLPLLLQMPILFALYGVITKPLTYISSIGNAGIELIKNAITTVNATLAESGAKLIELGGNVQINMIKLLTTSEHAGSLKAAIEAVDPEFNFSEIVDLNKSFSFFGLDLTETGRIDVSVYVLIPILTFAFSFLSTKIIRKFTYQPQMAANADSSQKASMGLMDWMMPLLSVWISLSIPSAIAIYWMFQNVLSAVQQILLFKIYPIPPVTEEMIKEAELQLKGKSKQNKQPVLSDDDFDDYDKTVKEETSSNNKKKKGVISSHKMKKLNPKVKEIYNQGRHLIAKKKI